MVNRRRPRLRVPLGRQIRARGRFANGFRSSRAYPVASIPGSTHTRAPQASIHKSTQNTSRGLVTRQPSGARRTEAGSALQAEPLSTHSTLSGLGLGAPPMRITRPIRVSLSSNAPPNAVSTPGELGFTSRQTAPLSAQLQAIEPTGCMYKRTVPVWGSGAVLADVGSRPSLKVEDTSRHVDPFHAHVWVAPPAVGRAVRTAITRWRSGSAEITGPAAPRGRLLAGWRSTQAEPVHAHVCVAVTWEFSVTRTS